MENLTIKNNEQEDIFMWIFCAFIVAIFIPRTVFALTVGILLGWHGFFILLLVIGGFLIDNEMGNNIL